MQPAVIETTLEVPSGAEAVAARLLAIELAIRDPSVPDATAAVVGHAQQRIYRAMAQDPTLWKAVIALLPAELRAPVEGGVAASAAMLTLVKAPRADLPPWRIEPPGDREILTALYHEAEAATGTPWSLLAAVHLAETRFGRIHGTSVAGAQGPMQFMPPTWAAYGLGGDIDDPHDAILGAGNYLAKSGAPGDVDKALWAYNHHPGYVAGVKGFAAVIAAEPLTLRGFVGWEVEYRTPRGWLWLPVGYSEETRVPIEPFCATWGAPYCP
jgi:hypothetical protein